MSDSPYTVRNYRPSDLEGYVKLRIAADKQQPGGQCNTPETVREALRRPGYTPEQDLFIVSTTGKVIGFTDITPELRSGRVVLDCFVQPEHRNQGLGSQLHNQAIRHAKELGAKTARISIWQDNTTAQRVLPRLGFRMVRRYLELWLPLTEVTLPDIGDIYSVRHLQPGEEDKLAQITR
jgi:GNAT superfamily N-acetyltransferase